MDEEVRQMEFDIGNNESGEYKVDTIWNNAVYVKKSKSSYLSGLYYLVSWKRYPKEENIWELTLVVQHLRKHISLFHKDHLDKPTTTFLAIDTAPPMVRPTVKLIEPSKQKRGGQANSTNNQVES